MADTQSPDLQAMIDAAVAHAIATYHPGEAAPAPPETPAETAHRLLGRIDDALHAETAVVSGNGRAHESIHALLAHLVAHVFPPEPVAEAAPTPVPPTPVPGRPETTESEAV